MCQRCHVSFTKLKYEIFQFVPRKFSIMIKDILIDNIYEILIITIEILNFFKKIMTASSFVSLKSMIATS